MVLIFLFHMLALERRTTRMSRLTSWEASLVDLLDQFHSATNPLDTNFQNTVKDFTTITKTLMGPQSGPDAFSSPAAHAFQQAIDLCLSRDQALIDADVLGQAITACNNFAQQIDGATNQASGFITDEPTLEEVIGAMSIFQAAQYGSAAIPQWIINAAKVQMHQPHLSPDKALTALNVQNTLQALEGMADTIHSDVSQWEQALNGDVSEHASFWGTVQQWENDAQTIFEVMSKLFHNEKIKNFAELLEKDKGSYLASLGFLLTILANPPKNPDIFIREVYDYFPQKW